MTTMTTFLESLGVSDVKATRNPVAGEPCPLRKRNKMFEFIPIRDNRSIGKIGNPILSADKTYYTVGVGDCLLLPDAIAQAMAKSEAGFTFMMCFGWDPTADGDQFSTFECPDESGNDTVYGNCARAGEDKLMAVSTGLAWNVDEYQGRQHDANAGAGSHIVSLRYDRRAAVPDRVHCGLDGSILVDERINAYGPSEPYSEDVAGGELAFYPTSHFYVGSRPTPAPSKTVPRVGYFCLWDIPLSNSEWRQAMGFGLGKYAV